MNIFFVYFFPLQEEKVHLNVPKLWLFIIIEIDEKKLFKPQKNTILHKIFHIFIFGLRERDTRYKKKSFRFCFFFFFVRFLPHSTMLKFNKTLILLRTKYLNYKPGKEKWGKQKKKRHRSNKKQTMSFPFERIKTIQLPREERKREGFSKKNLFGFCLFPLFFSCTNVLYTNRLFNDQSCLDMKFTHPTFAKRIKHKAVKAWRKMKMFTNVCGWVFFSRSIFSLFFISGNILYLLLYFVMHSMQLSQ